MVSRCLWSCTSKAYRTEFATAGRASELVPDAQFADDGLDVGRDVGEVRTLFEATQLRVSGASSCGEIASRMKTRGPRKRRQVSPLLIDVGRSRLVLELVGDALDLGHDAQEVGAGDALDLAVGPAARDELGDLGVREQGKSAAGLHGSAQKGRRRTRLGHLSAPSRPMTAPLMPSKSEPRPTLRESRRKAWSAVREAHKVKRGTDCARPTTEATCSMWSTTLAIVALLGSMKASTMIE